MSSQPYSSPYPAIAQVDVGGVSTLLPDTSTIGIEVDVAVAGLASQHTFAAKPLTTGAPQINNAPQMTLVLHAKPLVTKPPDIGGEPPPPPGVHRLQAARFKRFRKRASYMIDLIRSVLLDRVPAWRESRLPKPRRIAKSRASKERMVYSEARSED